MNLRTYFFPIRLSPDVVEVTIAGHEVGDGDLRRVLQHGQPMDGNGERQLIHSIPVGYNIDGSRGIRDPRGMYGERLGVDIPLVTASAGERGRGHVCTQVTNAQLV